MMTATECPVCEMSGQGCRTNGDGLAVSYVCQADAVNGHRLIRQGLDGGCEYRPLAGVAVPVESDPDAFDLSPVPASELSGDAEVSWTWTGFVAPGYTTLLAGLWKAGKTTLVGHVLRACGDGGHVGTLVEPCAALIVSEEPEARWKQRRDEIGIGDAAHFLCRPLSLMPDYPTWLRFVAALARLVERRGYKLVILDSLPAFWSVANENAASDVMRALKPLEQITGAGAGLLLLHHPRKGDGTEGQAARGSGALPGFVDVIIELRRFAPEQRNDRRRTLTAYSRWDSTPDELVIELTPTGYRSCGTKADAKRGDRLDEYQNILPGESPGMTVAEIREAWPDGASVPKPSTSSVRRDLDGAQDVHTTGTGRRNDAVRYWMGDKP